MNPQRSKSIGAILSSFISVKPVFLYSIITLLLTPAVCTAETYIYLDKKPILWIHPQDPVYKAWYRHADLIQLANMMEKSGKQALMLFAKTALTQMAMLYEAETVRSEQEESTDAEQNFNKSRWRQTAIEYTEQLRQISAHINETSEIELYIEAYGEPTIVIDGKPYMLTTPDLKKSGLLYTAIVEQLCKKEICLQDDETKDAKKDRSRTVIKAEWKIAAGAQPEYFSEDGLHFVFDDLKHRKKKQEICLQLMRELRLISDTLIEISSKGISIDWDVLDLELISGSYGHKVMLNRFGDSLGIELIYLGQIDALLPQTFPWMKARIKGEVFQQRFDQADELFSKFIN